MASARIAGIFVGVAASLFAIIALAAEGKAACDTADLACIERALLKQYPQVFSRKGATLTVRVPGQAEKKYTDEIEDDAKSPGYALLEYDPKDGIAVLDASYPTSPWTILLNTRSGQEVKVKSRPDRSPDRQRFAIAHFDLEFNDDSVLQVYRLDARRFAKEFDTDNPDNPIGWAPGDLKWSGNTKIAFTKSRRFTEAEQAKRPQRCQVEEPPSDCPAFAEQSATLTCKPGSQNTCAWTLGK